MATTRTVSRTVTRTVDRTVSSDAALFLNSSNLVANTVGLTGQEFQNKIANLGYLAGDELQFQTDVNAGNVILLSAYNAASVIFP